VRISSGGLRIVYVMGDCGVAGGHRVVFEHLNRLSRRGHECELYTIDGPPDWFPLDVPVRVFPSYTELSKCLAGEDAIKVATWWKTAEAVWLASVARGVPVYLVQDIEASFYPGDRDTQDRVMASYREEFRFVATSSWIRDQLSRLGLTAELVAPGVDLEAFRDLGIAARDDVLLSVGRRQAIKNLNLTLEAWRSMPKPRPRLWLYGVEPDIARGPDIRYFQDPTDAEINELINTATAIVQTSLHEGFCLPPLEAMAAGTTVICTDADGNRDFCQDGVNCLMPEAEPLAVRRAFEQVLTDAPLRRRLAAAGKETAESYAWDRQIERLERFYEGVASSIPVGRMP
jgi:glycosyltransferase involved in cell wall biosynthesis